MILQSPPQSELISDSILSSYAIQSSEAIEQTIEKELNEKNECLLIKCQPFTEKHFDDEDIEDDDFFCDADFCILFDEYHVPQDVLLNIYRFLENEGYSCQAFSPLKNVALPASYFQKDNRIKYLLIEVNPELESHIAGALFDKLLPYLAGENDTLSKDDFAGESLFELLRLNDWSYSKEDWDSTINYSSKEDEGLHENCWHEAVLFEFQSPSCESKISVWVEILYYFNRDQSYHSFELDVFGNLASITDRDEVSVDGQIYDFQGNNFECYEDESGFYGKNAELLLKKLLNLLRKDIKNKSENTDFVKSLEQNLKAYL